MRSGALMERELPDGSILVLYPQVTNWLLTITGPNTMRGIYDDGW